MRLGILLGGEQEVQRHIDTFIKKCEEFIKDSEEVEKYGNILNKISELGFEEYGVTIGHYKRENKDNTWWYLIVDFDEEKATIYLNEKQNPTFYRTTKPIKQFSIPLDKLPDYVENYGSTKK